jgi:hypothetical protein
LARYADGVFFLQKAWRESQSFGQILKKRICLRIAIPIRPLHLQGLKARSNRGDSQRSEP